MITVITILWILFAMLGQWGLLVLLGTLGVVSSLPQGRNPFLVNFLLTSFLATWPPCLLFFTAQQGDDPPPRWLCLMQSVLIDGVAPMFGTAMLVLVFHTWRTLRSKFLGETPVTMRSSWMKRLLLFTPYVVFILWCMASFTAALRTPMQLELGQFVYCANNSVLGTRVRRFVGFFMFGVGFLDLCVEFCIGRLVYLHRAGTMNIGGESYRASYRIALRILVFCSLQLVIILLSVFNALASLNSNKLKQATQVLESMNGLATFLVFGTQKDVLQTWKLRKGRLDKSQRKLNNLEARNDSEPDFTTIA